MITVQPPAILVLKTAAAGKPASTLATPVELRGFSTRSETTVHGKSAILFGLPFLGMGFFMILLAANVIHLKSRGTKAPPEVLGLAGAVFSAPGAILVLHGILGIVRRRRVARRRASQPNQPWFADFAWNPTRSRDAQAGRILSALYGFALMSLFSSPMNYIAFVSARSFAMELFVILTVDSFVAIFAFAFIYRLARWLKYGAAELRFDRFPFHPGESLKLQFVPARLPGGADRLTCTLRCIREAYETRPGYKRRTEVVVPYCHFEQTQLIESGSLSGLTDRSIPISFDIPENAPTTNLSDRPPTYWELEVSAARPGIDLNARFLIPIYERPGVQHTR